MINLQNPETWVVGRDLDALVARVMGWEDVKPAVCSDIGIAIWTGIPPDDTRYEELPGFSMWFEGMRLGMEWAELQAGLSSRVAPHTWLLRRDWRTGMLQFIFHTPSGAFCGPDADTAPLAVAKAILAYGLQEGLLDVA